MLNIVYLLFIRIFRYFFVWSLAISAIKFTMWSQAPPLPTLWTSLISLIQNYIFRNLSRLILMAVPIWCIYFVFRKMFRQAYEPLPNHNYFFFDQEKINRQSSIYKIKPKDMCMKVLKYEPNQSNAFKCIQRELTCLTLIKDYPNMITV